MTFKIGDVVREKDGKCLYVVVNPEADHSGCIDIYVEWRGLVSLIREDVLVKCPDKIALAPALYRMDEPVSGYRYYVHEFLFPSEIAARNYYDSIKLVRWPATQTNWIIVDKEIVKS